MPTLAPRNLRDRPDPRLAILGLLARLSRKPVRALHFAHAGIPPVENPLFVDWPRLNVVLSGRMEVVLPVAGGAATLRLAEGQGFFAQAGAWERIDWSGRFELLCMVPRVRYLRVSYYDQRSARRAAVQPSPVYHHTEMPYGEALRLALETLDAVRVLGNHEVALELARPFVRLVSLEILRRPERPLGKAKETFDRIQTWLENSFHEAVTREAAAARFGVSPAYLSRLFVSRAGLAFHESLTKCRLDHAALLLTRTELPIHHVGLQCGYGDPVHFGRRFRQAYGVSPGNYRAARAPTREK
ncbi:MAG: helix-turn-helix transcriptional regulator [Spirochaetes bacterium]|nr:helix-turn-helix transcriptional regulator [Spirochaetota bacterium]